MDLCPDIGKFIWQNGFYGPSGSVVAFHGPVAGLSLLVGEHFGGGVDVFAGQARLHQIPKLVVHVMLKFEMWHGEEIASMEKRRLSTT